MPWYYILLLVCVIIAPFDALYMYIKAEHRREELRRRSREKENNETKDDCRHHPSEAADTSDCASRQSADRT